MSILSGAHLELFPLILQKLRDKGLDGTIVLAGGIIPEEDHPALREMGIEGIFGPGTKTSDIASYIREATAARKAS